MARILVGLFLPLLAFSGCMSFRTERPALIPLPRKTEWMAGGGLSLLRVEVNLSRWTSPISPFLKGEIDEVLKSSSCTVLSKGSKEEDRAVLALQMGEVDAPRNADQAYRLVAEGNRVWIKAADERGLFFALQTLRQLIQRDEQGPWVPLCKILDWPAFKYRGLMHDVGRNFQSIPFLEKQMVLMSKYKLNLFHMHLTDNPGWRVESKKHKELNSVSSYRSTRHPGKFYTVEELKQFVSFCSKRGIMVLPEMDMPGHSQYFKKAFGFSMQTPKGAAVLEDEIADWVKIFPCPFFHIGSDEVRILMKDFIPRMVQSVNEGGKIAVVWSPGGPLPDKNMISQLWTKGAKPTGDHPFFDSRFTYLNNMDPLITPVRYFFLQYCLRPHGDDKALGGIMCYWPDTMVAKEEDSLEIAAFYPGMLANAESLWRGRKEENREYWGKLPPRGTQQWSAFAEFEERLLSHRDRYFKDEPFPYVRQTDIAWRLIGPFDNKGDATMSFPVEREIKESYVVDGKTYRWHEKPAFGGTVHIRHPYGLPSWIPNAKKGTVYAHTWIHSDEERDGWMWINFNTLSLSGGRRGAGNPLKGKWSWVESNVWMNGKTLPPPIWNHPGLVGLAGMEVPVTDETYVNRPPVRVHFKKGWNRLLIKAPAGRWKKRRSWKWCFTALPVEWKDGRASEPEGLSFSSDLQVEDASGEGK